MRRDKLIEVATELFERDGYDIPLEAVVAASGLGRATLYRNFPDRSALMIAVLTVKLADMERFVAAHEDDATLLPAFIRRQGLLASMHAPAIAGVMADTAQKTALALLTDRFAALLETIVVRSRTAGMLRPDVTAMHLRLATRMLMIALEPDDGNMTLDVAVDLLMHGFAPR